MPEFNKFDQVTNPTPAQVAAARAASDLDEYSAALLVYRTAREWAAWEAGTKKMDPALWELWQIKVTRWSASS